MGSFHGKDSEWMGGIFDFDGDGETSWDEEVLAVHMLETDSREGRRTFDDRFGDDFSEDGFCDDADEFCDEEDEICEHDAFDKEEEGLGELSASAVSVGSQDDFSWRDKWIDRWYQGVSDPVDPEDYETEEEYKEEIARRQAETEYDEDALYEELKEYFPNKRRFLASRSFYNEFLIYSNPEHQKRDRERWRFILEQGDTVPAANYLSHEGEFLYAQAVKEHFSLPCSLPEEDERQEIKFFHILRKLARRDIPLTFAVWEWCLEQFLPYARYDAFCSWNLSGEVLDHYWDFPEGFLAEIVSRMDKNREFCRAVVAADCDPDQGDPAEHIPNLIEAAFKEGFLETAEFLFRESMERVKDNWKEVNGLTERVLFRCKNEEELESMEYFRDHLFPLTKKNPHPMVQDEISGWEEEISAYIDHMEETGKKYAYSRKYEWRRMVPDGSEYGLNPLYYETEQEYLDAFQKEKYGWREWYRDGSGPDPDCFETEREYEAALEAEREEAEKKEAEERERCLLFARAKQLEIQKDQAVYTYCGVILPFSPNPFSFRTEDPTIGIGDKVLVSIGKEEKETEGTVVSVGQYTRVAVPYPLEKTKFILRKIEEP